MRFALARRVLSAAIPLALAALTAGVALAPVASGVGVSDAALYCGGTDNRVKTEFDIGHASDYATVFPHMGRSPELDGDARPAHVVVFEGTFDATDISVSQGEGDSPQLLTNVVCVVTADGIRNVYPNVDMTDARLP